MAPRLQWPESFSPQWAAATLVVLLWWIGPLRLLAWLAYLVFFIAGFITTLGFICWGKIHKHLNSPPLHPPRGIKKVVEAADNPAPQPKLDTRLTGYNPIDVVLQEVLEYVFRDYVLYWFKDMSDDPEFITRLRISLQSITISIASRCKEFDWVNFITVVAVDVLVKHIELFVRAERGLDRQSSNSSQRSGSHDVEAAFFELDPRFKAICNDKDKEKEYSRDLAEVLLYLTLREEDFHNRVIRYLCRELVAQSCLVPSIDMFADPDYANQMIAFYTDDSMLTYQAILDVIKASDDVEDLKVILENIELDLQAKLSEGEGDVEQNTTRYMAQIGSLHFAKRECETRRKELGDTVSVSAVDSSGRRAARELSLRFILHNNTALTYFMEFLGEIKMGHLLDFWLTAEGYRASAKTILSALAEFDDLEERRAASEEQIRAHGNEIYFQYLSETADFRVPMPREISAAVHKSLTSSASPKASMFKKAQQQVYTLLEQKYYPKFKKSDPYYRCIYTLNFSEEELSQFDSAEGQDDDDTASGSDNESEKEEPPSSPSISSSSLTLPDSPQRQTEDFSSGTWAASIANAETRKDGGKSFMMYTLEVTFVSDRTEKTHQWLCCRRFSEFHALHAQLKEQFAWVITGKLTLPPKKAFGMSKDVLDKRQQGLSAWLEMLCTQQIVDADPRIRQMVHNFLTNGAVEKQTVRSRAKSLLGNITRPRLGSTASSREPLPEGALLSTSPATSMSASASKSASASASASAADMEHAIEESQEAEKEPERDSIALRILLLLTEQIFELQGNQWLRRRIIGVLRSNIRGWLGDRINAKVVDGINQSTSAEQVAGYVTQFRDSFWPNGVLAPEYAARSEDCRTRTRVEAKAKLFGLIPDELQRVVGTATAKRGVKRIFNLFQHPKLNRRLVHALLEALFTELFPENKFAQVFGKLLEAANRPGNGKEGATTAATPSEK